MEDSHNARRLRPPSPRRLLWNVEQDLIVRLLLANGLAMRASRLFGEVNRLAQHPVKDFAAIASEAEKLASQGLVAHVTDARRTMVVSLTRKGAALEARSVLDRPARAGVLGVLPALASCVSMTSAPKPPQESYGARPFHAGAPTQFVVSGQTQWTLCKGTDCPRPTPKHVGPPALRFEGGRLRVPESSAPVGASVAAPPEVTGPSESDDATAPSPPAGGRVSGGVRPDPDAPGGTPIRRVLPRSTPSEKPPSVAPVPRMSGASFRPSDKPPLTAAPVIRSYSVFFRYGSAVLSAEELAAIELVAAEVASSSGRVIIVGMTDSSGTQDINAALAHKRSEGVRDLLIKSGVAQNRISTQGDVSGSRPAPAQAIPRRVASGSAQYRRADVVLIERRPELRSIVWAKLLLRAAGHRLHHPVEIEAAGLLPRRELLEALQPPGDVGAGRGDGEHMLQVPALIAHRVLVFGA